MKAKLTDKLIASLTLDSGTTWDEQLTGFGVRVGKTSRVFFVKGRVGGRVVKMTIGGYGKPREDGHTWNAARARAQARLLLGKMAAGIDPRPNADSRQSGGRVITLRDGVALHTKEMRKTCVESSAAKLEREVMRFLPGFLDRPIVDLTADDLEAAMDKIISESKPRAGAVNPPGVAMADRLRRHVKAVWNTTDKRHDLPLKNPASRLSGYSVKPRDVRVQHTEFESWFTIVRGMRSEIRRDMQLLTLFTGLRSSSVRHVRWDDVDDDAALLHVTKVKGGRQFTVPLSSQCRAILASRRKGNPMLMAEFGGDHGWVFPSWTRKKPWRVQPVAEPKEVIALDLGGDKKEKVNVLDGLHALRRTHNSVAIEVGIVTAHRESLLNHNGQGVNIKAYGRPQNWDFLLECQQKISDGIMERLGASSTDDLFKPADPERLQACHERIAERVKQQRAQRAAL